MPDPDRAAGLPSTASELIELADATTAERPRTPHRTDRALAALEAAAKKADVDTKEDTYEVDWRLARACFLLAEQVGKKEQRRAYAAKGREYGAAAVAADEGRVEGHYYLALNTASFAETSDSMDLIKPMVASAKRAAELDPAFDEAGPLRFLGKVYITAPAWPTSVGNPEKGVEMLEKAVELAPTAMNRIFLGEAYYHDDRDEEAERELVAALRHPDAEKLDKRWRREAEDYLDRIRTGEQSSEMDGF